MGQQVWPSTKDMLVSSLLSANGSRLARSGSLRCGKPCVTVAALQSIPKEMSGEAEPTSCAVAEGLT